MTMQGQAHDDPWIQSPIHGGLQVLQESCLTAMECNNDHTVDKHELQNTPQKGNLVSCSSLACTCVKMISSFNRTQGS